VRLRSASPVCHLLSLLLLLLLVVEPRTVSVLAAPSPETERLFNSATIPLLRLEIASQGMGQLRRTDGNPRGRTDRPEVSGILRDGTNVFTDVQIHLKGAAGSFRPIDSKPAFTLNFSKKNKGQRFHGLDKISLNNSVQDPSYHAEQISREFFRKAGVPAPRARNVLLELNGRKLGVYVLTEGWTRQFLKDNFQDPNGVLFDGGFSRDINEELNVNVGSEPADYAALQKLIQASTDPDPARRIKSLEFLLDLDRFYKLIALEVLTAHWDGYAMNRNNYRVYVDTAGRATFLPHGMDQMFGVWSSTPTSPITPSMRGIVARAAMSGRDGRERYMKTLSTLYTNFYDTNWFTKRLQELSGQLRPALQQHYPNAIRSHEAATRDLIARINLRSESIREQLSSIRFSPLTFEGTNSVTLTNGWKSHIQFGNPAVINSSRELSISLNGPSIVALRQLVLLEPGRYQFTFLGKLENVRLNPSDSRTGVGPRISGDRFSRAHQGSTRDFVPMTHNFEVEQFGDRELIIEMRATSGRLIVQPESIRVVKVN
jgi:hypothetical protein